MEMLRFSTLLKTEMTRARVKVSGQKRTNEQTVSVQ